MTLCDPVSATEIFNFSQERIEEYRHDESAQKRLALIAHRAYPNTIYPPLIISNESCTRLASTAEKLLRLIGSIPDLLFDGDISRWLSEQGFVDSEADFFIRQLNNTPKEKVLAVARGDALVTNGGFKYVEMNISPALGGLGTCDGYTKRIKASRLLSYLSHRGIEIVMPDVDQAWMKSVRSLIWPGYDMPDLPIFFEAIADPTEAPENAFDRPEWVNGLTSAGFLVLTGHVSQLQITPHGVFVANRRVDVVYFCFTYHEMVHHQVDKSLILALTDADHSGIVNLFTSFATIPYDNKVNYAFLTDPKNRDRFSADQLALIDTYIPKSTILHEDSLDLFIDSKNTLVLKAGTEFGGKNIFIGSNLSDLEWGNLLRKALESGKPYILQEEISDIWVDNCGNTSNDQFTVCVAPMLFGMRFGGALLRVAKYSGRTEVVNVARGASFGTALVRSI